MELMRNDHKRVVITGMGVLSPLGNLPSFWEGLKQGKSGIRRIRSFDPRHIAVQIAGEVDFDPLVYLEYKEARRMARASQMAQVAARMAMKDAGLSPDDVKAKSDRVGVVIGTGEGGYEVASHSLSAFRTANRRPHPLALVHALPNMPAFHVGLETGATGPLMTVVTACASGTQSVGEAARLIQNGNTDVAFTGGVEALILDYVLEALDSMGVLAKGYNDNPTAASKPFDANRSGFVFSEAAAILVLESLEHALRRGARIYAEVLGYAASSDAFHITAPDPEGRGAQKAMRWALDNARIVPTDVDYINAHGTATKLNDAIETVAIKRVFGDYAYKVPISSTKSMVGHCLGASGAVEVVACVLSITEGVILPTINYETPDPECDLDYVPNTARQAKLKHVLSNSFGFGGQNACIVLGAI